MDERKCLWGDICGIRNIRRVDGWNIRSDEESYNRNCRRDGNEREVNKRNEDGDEGWKWEDWRENKFRSKGIRNWVFRGRIGFMGIDRRYWSEFYRKF